jgi:transposase
MARRTFDVVDVTEILIHWYAGRSLSEVSTSLGVDRKTIRKYLAPAIEAGMGPGGPALSQTDWARLVTGWFPGLVDARLRQTTWPQIAAYHDYITGQLKAGVTQATIHQRLRDEHGLGASVASLKRYVAANLPEEVRRDRVVVLRDRPAEPGLEAQIDYGHLGHWVDPASGKRRRVWAFVMVLACSRHLFVRPVLTMDQRAWTEAHVAAFAFFGGVPARLVPDNLRTGVDKPDLYDPKINRSYAELAAHYGALVDPARAAKPRDKPRVERPMPYVRDSFWRGRDFTSVAAMQADAVRWCTEVAGARACRPLNGAAPAAVFAAVEQQELLPLPTRPFVLASWSTATVGPDIHARVGKTIYSVPWRLIGQRLDARETPTVVQFFHRGQVVATHGRKPSGKQTDFGHYPPEKIAFAMRTPTWCRTQAADIGPSAQAVIGGLLEINALFRLRAAQGVIGLAAKHGPGRLEAACARAIAVGDPSYRTIRGILAAGTETDPPPPAAGDAGAPAHLHGPAALFGNVVALPTTNDRPTGGSLPAVNTEQDHAEPSEGPDAATGGRDRHGHHEPQDQQPHEQRREDEQTGTAAS